jgi:glycosyltransferase involved in cell wall biosynthesis
MLTVLFATRNRSGILRNVLESFCHLQSPPSGWKLVIVDNGSTDETAQVIASFAKRLPLHSVLEPKLGKNSALNTGLGLVEGDLTVLTDDDVFPHADWLVQLRKAADAHPECSMFGGAVVPRWEVRPPHWIRWGIDPCPPKHRICGPLFTLTDPSLQEGPISPWLIYGPNMAIRTGVFRSGARFDSSIGPNGSSYAMGSETEILLRLSLHGHQGWHVRDAVVEHFVRKEQLNKAWILQRAIRSGRGRYRLSANVKLWMGIPRHVFLGVSREILYVAIKAVLLRDDSLFRSRLRLNVLRGEAIEARIIGRERRARAQLASSMGAPCGDTGERTSN